MTCLVMLYPHDTEGQLRDRRFQLPAPLLNVDDTRYGAIAQVLDEGIALYHACPLTTGLTGPRGHMLPCNSGSSEDKAIEGILADHRLPQGTRIVLEIKAKLDVTCAPVCPLHAILQLEPASILLICELQPTYDHTPEPQPSRVDGIEVRAAIVVARHLRDPSQTVLEGAATIHAQEASVQAQGLPHELVLVNLEEREPQDLLGLKCAAFSQLIDLPRPDRLVVRLPQREHPPNELIARAGRLIAIQRGTHDAQCLRRARGNRSDCLPELVGKGQHAKTGVPIRRTSCLAAHGQGNVVTSRAKQLRLACAVPALDLVLIVLVSLDDARNTQKRVGRTLIVGVVLELGGCEQVGAVLGDELSRCADRALCLRFSISN